MADRTCVIDGCDGCVMARGWCSKHYNRWYTNGDPLAMQRPQAWESPCAVEGCGRKVEAKGWCAKHYGHFRRHGHPVKKKWRPRPCVQCGQQIMDVRTVKQRFCSTQCRERYSDPAALCVVEGCQRPANVPGAARNLCRAHYRRWQAHGAPDVQPMRPRSWGTASCSVKGCADRVYGHGLCRLHWARKHRSGMVTLPIKVIRLCMIKGCDERSWARGLCKRHYDQARGPRPGNASNPEMARARARLRRVRMAGASGNHTVAEWLAKLTAYGCRCAYCGKSADTRDHVVPISRGGTHDISNIVPACRSCNSRKGARTPEEWRRQDGPQITEADRQAS